jgi:hypothetical protein
MDKNFQKDLNNTLKEGSLSGFKIFATIMLVVFMLSGVGMLMGWFGSVAEVAKKEFGPQAMLTKYEWFINASNELEKMDSDIQIYSGKQAQLCVPGMDRISREQCMTWGQEVAGIKSAYNGLVSEYNSASQKFNWKSFNTKNIQTSYVRK